MPVIDADAHVIESEQTWDFIPASEQRHRPVFHRKGEHGATRDGWLIDGKTLGVPVALATVETMAARSRATGRDMVATTASRELADVGARVRHMDELGVDVQVLHSTLFLEQVATRPEVEVPLCQAYNRWMAEVWKQGGGRLRWTCVPPLLSVDDALDEIRFSAAHGACGVFMRPLEGDKLLIHPDFYPVYEEAQRLDLCIAVHLANANPAMCDMLAANPYPGSGFWKFRLPTIGAFQSLAMSEVPDLFPHLRFGFLEAAAQWVPYVLFDLRRRPETRPARRAATVLHDLRFYVTCQTDDDLPYLIQQGGDDWILLGTDYGHSDPSTELNAFFVLRDQCGLDRHQYEKIVDQNPATLYGLHGA
jgi:predicted TIM-barrel fold metal-dependent hydrolase